MGERTGCGLNPAQKHTGERTGIELLGQVRHVIERRCRGLDGIVLGAGGDLILRCASRRRPGSEGRKEGIT